MFLPWTILGMRSDTGWEQDYFFVLFFWAYPFFNAHGNNNSNTISKILIICSGLGLIRFINPLEEFVVLGEIYSWRVGAGSYIYLVAWLTGRSSGLDCQLFAKNIERTMPGRASRAHAAIELVYGFPAKYV